MKEQISVDDVNAVIRKLHFGEMPEKTAAWQAFLKAMGREMPVAEIKNGVELYNGSYNVAVLSAIEAYIEESQKHVYTSEYERLKRLDENVKREISFLKSDIEELERTYVSQCIINDIKEQLAELESLYK